MLASLQATGAWGFPFIYVEVGGFGVDSVITSVLAKRFASFFVQSTCGGVTHVWSWSRGAFSGWFGWCAIGSGGHGGDVFLQC